MIREWEYAPMIAIGEGAVTLNGMPVDDDSLYDVLATLKNNFKLLHPSEPFRGAGIVVADKDVTFDAIKKVMYACARADYPHIGFMVQPKPH